ncbi:MAG: LacI family transcriptional regulator [Lentisphaerae bacterium]|nr:LacI family transcriptional regulator [Lentisphaerota bacterium]MCP4103624.1 LacI family transcriptional regulator [Lentisphaerota bacterium]
MATVTLKQIAIAANTSIRTVNRALKGQQGIGEAKRKEILELASKMGYTPNIAARNLRLQRSNFVGVIGYKNIDGVFSRRLNDLVQRLEAAGFYPILGMPPENVEDCRKMLLEWSGFVKHVVLFQSLSEELRNELSSLPQHFISIDYESISDGTSLTIDRSSGVKDGILHLVKSGCKKIFWCGKLASREEGLRKALDELSDAERPEYGHIQAGINFDDGYAIGSDLIASGVDAAFFDTDRMALGFLKYSWRHNIKVPEQIKVIGFDNDTAGQQSCPALSTVAHPIDEMNNKIVELVENAHLEAQSFEFKTSFISRESA